MTNHDFVRVELDEGVQYNEEIYVLLQKFLVGSVRDKTLSMRKATQAFFILSEKLKEGNNCVEIRFFNFKSLENSI